MPQQYWIMKCEPSVYSINDLKRDGQTTWEGVRNYQARNYINQMAVGDRAFFYHSNATPPGIAGVMTIASEPYPDTTALDPEHRYYEPASTPENPRWSSITVSYESRFSSLISIDELRAYGELSDLIILRKGNRLSVTPISQEAYYFIMNLGK